MKNIIEISGDLFTSKNSLCHCISNDKEMGKGIAVSFKKLFGKPDITNGIGTVSIIQENERFIYNLVTKSRYFHKPTYESLKSCLIEMKNHAIENNVKNIDMPRIGCGLDRLEWKIVKKNIQEIFEETDIIITVYVLTN